MRKQPMRIVLVLQRIQPWQLPLRIPAQLALIAVPVVDVDFDVARAGAAGRDEDAARVAPDLRGQGREERVSEADVEEAG